MKNAVVWGAVGGAIVVRRGVASRRTAALGERAAPGAYARRWAEATALAAELRTLRAEECADPAQGRADRFLRLAAADGCEFLEFPCP